MTKLYRGLIIGLLGGILYVVAGAGDALRNEFGGLYLSMAIIGVVCGIAGPFALWIFVPGIDRIVELRLRAKRQKTEQ